MSRASLFREYGMAPVVSRAGGGMEIFHLHNGKKNMAVTDF